MKSIKHIRSLHKCLSHSQAVNMNNKYYDIDEVYVTDWIQWIWVMVLIADLIDISELPFMIKLVYVFQMWHHDYLFKTVLWIDK